MGETKKVMIAISSLTGGGAERVVSIWASQLAECGYDVSLLLYGREKNEYPIHENIKVSTIADNYKDYKNLGYFARLRRMRKIVKKVNPDVVINFLPRIQIWMMMATFGMRITKVETVRISLKEALEGKRALKFLLDRCYNRAKKIIVQTDEQMEYFKKRNQKKCVVIPNPFFGRYNEVYKTKYSDKITNFIAAGRITEQKNYPLMIESFSKALKTNENLTLSIYGKGDEDYVSKIQKLIEQTGYSDKIKLMGRTSDLPNKLIDADAFIMTSDYEGMPNALLEAMATGLPCVSTDCPTGPKDLIDDGINGFLVKVGDTDSVSSAIEKVAKLDKEQVVNIGKSAREKILDLCSEENSLKKLIDVIETAQ